ncbi:MAG: hypothetical protein KDK48_01100 [Chlamydiia bacterium]|nr:hypothetical protein [Chlamydiia bacterium]
MIPDPINNIKAFFHDYDPHGSQDLVVDPDKHNLMVVDANTGEKRVLTNTDQTVSKATEKHLKKVKGKAGQAVLARETAQELANVVRILQRPQEMSDALEGAASIALKFGRKIPENDILEVISKLQERASCLEMEDRWAATAKEQKALIGQLQNHERLPGLPKAPDVQLKEMCRAYNERGVSDSTGEDWRRYLQRGQVEFIGFEQPAAFPEVNVDDPSGERQKVIAGWLVRQFSTALELEKEESDFVESSLAEIETAQNETEFAAKMNAMANRFHESPSPKLQKLSLALLSLNQKFFVEPGLAVAQIAKTDPEVARDLGQYPGSCITLKYDAESKTLYATGKGAFCNKQHKTDGSGHLMVVKTADKDPVHYVLRYDCTMALDLSSEEPRWVAGAIETKVGIPILRADEEKAGAIYRLLEASGLHPVAFKCLSICKEDSMP